MVELISFAVVLGALVLVLLGWDSIVVPFIGIAALVVAGGAALVARAP